jgi:hypothetical protein
MRIRIRIRNTGRKNIICSFSAIHLPVPIPLHLEIMGNVKKSIVHSCWKRYIIQVWSVIYNLWHTDRRQIFCCCC